MKKNINFETWWKAHEKSFIGITKRKGQRLFEAGYNLHPLPSKPKPITCEYLMNLYRKYNNWQDMADEINAHREEASQIERLKPPEPITGKWLDDLISKNSYDCGKIKIVYTDLIAEKINAHFLLDKK